MNTLFSLVSRAPQFSLDHARLALVFLGGALPAAAAPGDVDPVFDTVPEYFVNTIATQPDGKLVIAGEFDDIDGVERLGVARLNADGSLDPSYNPNAGSNPFSFGNRYTCGIQTDGKLVVGGGFSRFGGVERFSLARANANGWVDAAYDPGPDGEVTSSALQPDGKLLIGGTFNSVSGVTRNSFARINADGTLDTTFNPNVGSSVYSISIQADGKIVIGGQFDAVGGVARPQLARLHANGTRDTSFNPTPGTGPLTVVNSTAVQADGKILIGGRFTVVNGSTRNYLARLHADGSLDSSFNPNANDRVFNIAVQCDGKIIIAGAFSTVRGSTRRGIARLNANGTLDTAFTGIVDSSVDPMGLQPDGKIVIGGSFTTVGGATRRLLARLLNDPATQHLTVPVYNRVQWLRGGSSPETVEVTFDLSTNGGSTWTPLGAGTRIAGGWTRTGLNLPLNGLVRGRARNPSGSATAFMDSVMAFSLAREIAVHDGPLASAPEIPDGQTTAVDFGVTRQGTPVTRIFTIVNSGTARLRVIGVTAPAGYTVTGTLPAVLEPNQTLVVPVRLDAAARGTFAGALTISNDDLTEATYDFPLTGTIVSPEIDVHDGALAGPELTDGQPVAVDFGNHIQGTPGVRSFTLVNTGSAELRVSAFALPPGYTVLNPPPHPLIIGTGLSVTLQISLTTLTVGTHAGAVVIESDDIDEEVFDFPITGSVIIPHPVAAITAARTRMNRQTGLREQTIHITNNTTATVPAYNLIIRGLPPGVEVNNASETRADGSVVVYVGKPMAPHSSRDLIIEYYSADRTPADINPQLSTEVVLAPLDFSVPAADAGLAITNVTSITGGALLIEFTSVPGRRYQIQYSSAGQPWQASLPEIHAASNRTQWIDRGQPRTDSHPSQAESRLYRVRELAP